MTEKLPFKLLRPITVCQMLGISRPTLHRFYTNNPNFPRPVQIGESSIGFVEAEIMSWLERRRIPFDVNKLTRSPQHPESRKGRRQKREEPKA